MKWKEMNIFSNYAIGPLAIVLQYVSGHIFIRFLKIIESIITVVTGDIV